MLHNLLCISSVVCRFTKYFMSINVSQWFLILPLKKFATIDMTCRLLLNCPFAPNFWSSALASPPAQVAFKNKVIGNCSPSSKILNKNFNSQLSCFYIICSIFTLLWLQNDWIWICHDVILDIYPNSCLISKITVKHFIKYSIFPTSWMAEYILLLNICLQRIWKHSCFCLIHNILQCGWCPLNSCAYVYSAGAVSVPFPLNFPCNV